jgi:uncharacterized membrane protein YfcA
VTEIGFVLLGLATATMAVAVGVGGGIVYVPALTFLFDFAQKDAQGTSVAVIAPASLIATAINHQAGWVRWPVAFSLAIGAVIGAVGGAEVAKRLDDTLLRRLFAVLLVVTATRMILRSRDSR